LVGYRVCDKLFGILVGEGSKTNRHLRQAIEPSSQPPFQLEAFKKRRADEKGPADKYLNKDQIDQQDWWGAVCLPSNLKQERFIAVFSEDVVKIFGEALPHKSVRVASTGLRVPQINIPNGLFSSKGSLLQQLKAQNLLDQDLSESTFYHLLRTFFPHVCIQKWTPFSKCDVCSRIKQELFGSKEGVVRDKLLRELAAHRGVVTLSRLRLAARSLFARAAPGSALYAIADGMDSGKTFSPHVITHFSAGKGLGDRGRHLKTKLMGVLIEGEAFNGFIIYPHYSGGPNILCTALHLTFCRHAERCQGLLPPVLFLQLDNCGGDNKNHTVFAYLGYLVQIGAFHTILVDFLPVGEKPGPCALCTTRDLCKHAMTVREQPASHKPSGPHVSPLVDAPNPLRWSAVISLLSLELTSHILSDFQDTPTPSLINDSPASACSYVSKMPTHLSTSARSFKVFSASRKQVAASSSTCLAGMDWSRLQHVRPDLAISNPSSTPTAPAHTPASSSVSARVVGVAAGFTASRSTETCRDALSSAAESTISSDPTLMGFSSSKILRETMAYIRASSPFLVSTFTPTRTTSSSCKRWRS
jgi:hypothetical protein